MTQTDVSWLGPVIDVRPVLAKQQAALIDLLRQLDTNHWHRPTVCPGWSVKDIAAHLLGDHIGRLSIQRDHDVHAVREPRAGETVPALVDRISKLAGSKATAPMTSMPMSVPCSFRVSVMLGAPVPLWAAVPGLPLRGRRPARRCPRRRGG